MNGKINEVELLWISDGIKGLLFGTNGTDRFPAEFYEEAKRLVNYGNK